MLNICVLKEGTLNFAFITKKSKFGFLALLLSVNELKQACRKKKPKQELLDAGRNLNNNNCEEKNNEIKEFVP